LHKADDLTLSEDLAKQAYLKAEKLMISDEKGEKFEEND
jgi:hypothetical protein